MRALFTIAFVAFIALTTLVIAHATLTYSSRSIYELALVAAMLVCTVYGASVAHERMVAAE